VTVSETPEGLTEQDEQDIFTMMQEATAAAPTRTLLETWRELLSSIEPSAAERMTPQTASRISAAWPQVKIQETPRYNELYHDYLTDLREILLAEIEGHPEALKRIEKDGEENAEHYLNLLLLWQQQVAVWQHEWDAAGDEAHIELAAMADAQGFFLGATGIVNHLDSIGFEFNAEDSAALMVELEQFSAAL
jgi:hypothetical protein